MTWIVEITHSVHFPIVTRSMGRRRRDSEPVKKMGLPLLGWFRYDQYHG